MHCKHGTIFKLYGTVVYKFFFFEVDIFNVASYLMSKCYIKAFQTTGHTQGRVCSYLLLKSYHVHRVTHFSIFQTPGVNHVFFPKPPIQITDKSKEMSAYCWIFRNLINIVLQISFIFDF